MHADLYFLSHPLLLQQKSIFEENLSQLTTDYNMDGFYCGLRLEASSDDLVNPLL